MAIRGRSTEVTFTCWNTATNRPEVDAQSLLTMSWVKDTVPSVPTNAPQQVNSTTNPGLYAVLLTDDECDCVIGTIGGVSSNPNVQVISQTYDFEIVAPIGSGSGSSTPDVAYSSGNPYASVIWCNQYFESERLNSDQWFRSTNANQYKALLMATRILNKFNWMGTKTVSTQAFDFPRTICEDDVGVPDAIMRATAEIAFHLLDGWNPDLESNNLGTTSQGLPGIRETYDPNAIPLHTLLGLPSQTVSDLIRPYFREDGSVKISRV